MKKVFKRMLSLIVSATMLVTVFSVLSIPISAKGVFDDAIKMEELEYYSKTFKAYDTFYYKINIPSDGILNLFCEKCKFHGYTHDLRYTLLTANSEKVLDGGLDNNYKNEIKDLSKGTYYLKVYSESSYERSFTNLYYSFKRDEKPTIKLDISIYEGSSLKLGAIVSNSDSSVTWLSTKPKVASVSSKGKVKGLKAGKSTIRASLKSGEYVEIRVTVVEKE